MISEYDFVEQGITGWVFEVILQVLQHCLLPCPSVAQPGVLPHTWEEASTQDPFPCLFQEDKAVL